MPKTAIRRRKVRPEIKLAEATIGDIKTKRFPDQRYYRVIIGAHGYRTTTHYFCYRKDEFSGYAVDRVDFNDPYDTNDVRFIFTENEYESLLDHLLKFDDGNFYMIAELGKREVDPFSLLPII